jgi:glycosyltransferase involved in cell wall biosynthesis
MNFLVNASNLKQGGGIQVAQSVCGELYKYSQHNFVVVLSTTVDVSHIPKSSNVDFCVYNIRHSLSTICYGNDVFLDQLVVDKDVDAVLTVFGPSLWRPKVPHLCGFARAQLLLKVDGYKLTIKEKLIHQVWKWLFKKSSDIFYTENEFISDQLPSLFGDVKVYTVTNYYNQVFDQPNNWKRTRQLPVFDGVTMLSVSSHYPHKNFEIAIGAAKLLRENYPDFKFRFVLTFDSAKMPVPEEVRENFVFLGKVGVDECPYLYEQSDIMFMPTLMECFTATYPEAMRMGVPIVTTDLEFAHGLCGEAACYYSAVDTNAAAEAIYKVSKDPVYKLQLTENGKVQLKKFDNYVQRAEKLIKVLEDIAK